ncbi:MAG: biotin transporter BioY [Bacillota bacterium]|nr:biotin transporter BioY [Bacillota bacterium]
MKTRNLVITALFTALTAVCAQIAVPVPISAVPVTLSTLAVFLTGSMLDRRSAFYAQLAYLLLGGFGIPVFAGFQGGFARVLGPTGGYLAAFPLMAYLTALIIEKSKTFKSAAGIVGMAASLLLCYTIGTAWLALSAKMSLFEAFLAGVAPFILPDLLKIAAAAAVCAPVKRAVKSRETVR